MWKTTFMIAGLMLTLALQYNQVDASLLENIQKRRKGKDPPPIVPANKIQPKDLKKCLDCPKPRDYKLKRLMKKIGRLDKNHLSISKPSFLGSKVEDFRFGTVRASQKRLLKELVQKQSLRIPGYSNNISGKIEKLLLRWLLGRSFCPLEHKWSDLGTLYWPRWVKVARCVGKPCSWPPGMSCKPSTRSFVSLLRWQCRLRSKRWKKKKYLRRSKFNRKSASKSSVCRWLKIKYPITTKCSCTCK